MTVRLKNNVLGQAIGRDEKELRKSNESASMGILSRNEFK